MWTVDDRSKTEVNNTHSLIPRWPLIAAISGVLRFKKSCSRHLLATVAGIKANEFFVRDAFARCRPDALLLIDADVLLPISADLKWAPSTLVEHGRQSMNQRSGSIILVLTTEIRDLIDLFSSF
jgi:hypothetical protein